MSEPIRVALPLGLGDCHWVCQKLQGLAKYHNSPIHAYVNNSEHHKSINYLKMVPFISECFEIADAPKNIDAELPKYMDDKWSTLSGSSSWRKFHYMLQANGHLEKGLRIESFLPEISTDYTYPLHIPSDARRRAFELCPHNNPVLIYMSGTGPNGWFHNLTWAVADWVDVIKRLNAEGITPYLIGADTHQDKEYRDWFLGVCGDAKFFDLTGQTNTFELIALLEGAGIWIGLNSGGGIISAMLGVPTLMMWSDKNQGGLLHHNMQKSWLTDWQLETYRTFSYKTPELTSANVVKTALEIIR